MHYPHVLERFGCTQARLREVFTSGVAPDTTDDISLDVSTDQIPQQPKTNQQINRRFRNRIRSRTIEGVTANLKAARPNQAVDLAADAPPIQRHMIPLMMWGQGKLKLESAYANICATGGQEQADKFFRREKVENTEVIKLNENRLTDISIDLLKSYVTRRHAAMDALWSNLWPLLRYDPRGTSDVALCRADVLTQRVDIISDSYNYRHFFSQCRRQMLLYGWSVAFPRCAWDRQTSWKPKPTNTGEPGDEIESEVTREGVDFHNPHPSRIFWDLSAPLANINTDTGPTYLGYWDVVPWRTLVDQRSSFFNLKNIFVTNGWTSLAATYGEFFGYYFDPCVLNWPDIGGPDPTLGNDIKANVGRYTSQSLDVGIFLTHYFEKINPLYEGIGKYDAEVWLHLTVAGDCTVVAAEFLPSLPGCYGAINCNDGRLANQSFGMALLAYQDMASNIMSSLRMQLNTSLIQLWLIDKDSLDADIVAEFKKNATDSTWWIDRKLLIYSASKLRDLGILDPRSAFAVVQANIQNVFEAALKALAQTLNLCDRLTIMSPNELGQPNPREVAAREVTEIATTVQAISGFNNQGPREQMAAVKELVFDSLVTNGTRRFRAPVEKRYTKEVIKRAGFEIPSDVKLSDDDLLVPVNTPVLGDLWTLDYDYYFNSRDGSERVLNTQGAQVMGQTLQYLLSIDPVAKVLGIKNIVNIANGIIRMSGAPTDVQIELPQGMGDELPNDKAESEKMIAAIQMQLQRIEQILMQVLKIPPEAFAPPQAPQGQGAQPAPNGNAAPAALMSAAPVNGNEPALLQDNLQN